MHSHLLTGRLENKTLNAFALEVFKKFLNQTDLQQVNDDEEFRIPHKAFKMAARKATELISSLPKSILKKRLSDMDLANADVSLRR